MFSHFNVTHMHTFATHIRALHRSSNYAKVQWIAWYYNVVYLRSNYCFKKKNWYHYVFVTHGTPHNNFLERNDVLKKCEACPSSKHNNFAHLCSHLNGTKLHCWRRICQTLKYHHVCSDEAIDKSPLFSVNQLTLTCVELKLFMSRLWNEGYSMLMCAILLPAVSIIMMKCWSVLWHFLQLPLSYLRSLQTIVPRIINHRAYVRFWIF